MGQSPLGMSLLEAYDVLEATSWGKALVDAIPDWEDPERYVMALAVVVADLGQTVVELRQSDAAAKEAEDASPIAPYPPESRDGDPFPLLEEVADPEELPTVGTWLDAGAPMREVTEAPAHDGRTARPPEEG